MATKVRLKELVWTKASALKPNPNNWRQHPVMQRTALESMLDDVGLADVLLAYENNGELMLIDGHLRADLLGDDVVPVGVLDLTQEEADKVLATLDPLAGLALADESLLQDLITNLKFNDEAIVDMLNELLYIVDEPVPTFDELDQEYGDGNDDDFYPVISIKVSPETKRLYDEVMDKQSGDTDSEKFHNLLGKVKK